MKKLTAILGAISLGIASFFLGNYLAMSQAKSIVRTGIGVATSNMATSSLLRVAVNTRILESIKADKTPEAIKWACKDLYSARKNLKEISDFESLNRENIRKSVEMADDTYAASCGNFGLPTRPE